jgi:hypothetical protein
MTTPTGLRDSSFGRWGACFFLVAAIAGACGSQAGRWLRSPVPAAESPLPAILNVPVRTLSIGDVWESSAYPWTLPIKNTSDQPVEIEGIGTSCNCTTIEPSRFTIPAGSVREVRLKLDLTSHKEQPTEATRDFSVSITPRIKGTERGRKEGWEVTARVRSAIRLDVRGVAFPSASRLAERPCPSGQSRGRLDGWRPRVGRFARQR